MDLQDLQLLHNRLVTLDRFVSACKDDERVVAAFLGGSVADGTNDTYSDLDLYLITSDKTYEDFLSECDAFISLVGKPLFLEDFGLANGIFFILADGTEGELWIGRESQFDQIHAGPFRTLLDKEGILVNARFPHQNVDPDKQTRSLKEQIYWFWHELSHFITALGRGQLWWAYGQLEAMRHICIKLARLNHNFSNTGVEEEPYFKIEQAIPEELLSPLKETYCPLATNDIYHAVRVVLTFYQELAPGLAEKHGLSYPADLERIMTKKLQNMADSTINNVGKVLAS